LAYTVGEVARLAHVSVRTLHHYDEIGLLAPEGRSDVGYRLYSDTDLARLQQILFYRELDFPLGETARLLGKQDPDPLRALLGQRELIEKKLAHDKQLLALIDKTIDSMERGMALTKEEMFEVFGDFDPTEYEAEAEQRWGDTDAYAESARRTKRYKKEDWAALKAEQDAVNAQMVAVYDAGTAPDEPAATDVAEGARLIIDRWFYPLTREAHVCLGEMYIADPRFTKTYEDMRAGLAQWWYEAIKANADTSADAAADTEGMS